MHENAASDKSVVKIVIHKNAGINPKPICINDITDAQLPSILIQNADNSPYLRMKRDSGGLKTQSLR